MLQPGDSILSKGRVNPHRVDVSAVAEACVGEVNQPRLGGAWIKPLVGVATGRSFESLPLGASCTEHQEQHEREEMPPALHLVWQLCCSSCMSHPGRHVPAACRPSPKNCYYSEYINCKLVTCTRNLTLTTYEMAPTASSQKGIMLNVHGAGRQQRTGAEIGRADAHRR